LAFGLRQFRDLFAKDLLTSAFGGLPPSPSTLFIGDLGGAAVAFVLLVHFSSIDDNKAALQAMLRWNVVLTLFLGLVAQAFRTGLLGPLAWHFCTGVGIFGITACTSPAFWDRLMSASGESITCTFFILAADSVGYIGQLSLFCWKLFGGQSGDASPDRILGQFIALTLILVPLISGAFVFASWYFQVTLAQKTSDADDEKAKHQDVHLGIAMVALPSTAIGKPTIDEETPRESDVESEMSRGEEELTALMGQKVV